MIYEKTGHGIMVDGTFYSVGMMVYANDTSEYAGLYGIITEIRTDEDRETENDTPDIYCQFSAPVLPSELEERFSALYSRPTTLEDIALDMVIMAPDMLEFHIDPYTISPSTTVWAVIEDWATVDETGHNEYLYESEKDAAAVFHLKLANEAEEGLIRQWKDRDDYQFESDSTSFECWLDDDWSSNHYVIRLEKKLVVTSAEATKSIP